MSNISSMTPLLGDDSIFLGILQLTGASQPCVSCDGVTPRVPGPATLVLLGTGFLAQIAARRLLRRR
jgi:hypothetical protein